MAGDIIVKMPKPKKVKIITSDKGKMKALNELKQITKDINTRFKVSDELFDRKRKLKEMLGIE